MNENNYGVSSCVQCNGLERCRSLLVYDAFGAHVTKTVKASFVNENTDLAVLLGLLTRAQFFKARLS